MPSYLQTINWPSTYRDTFYRGIPQFDSAAECALETKAAEVHKLNFNFISMTKLIIFSTSLFNSIYVQIYKYKYLIFIIYLTSFYRTEQ